MHEFDQKKIDIKNMLSKLAGYYTKVSDDRLENYAKDLHDFKLDDIKRACRSIADTEERFPSLSQIKSIIRSYKQPRNESLHDPEIMAKIEKENKRLDEIKKSPLLQDPKIIKAWVKYWCVGMWGKDFLDNKQVGYMAFEKPALFDLVEASFDKEKAIQIGKRKEVKNQLAIKNKKYYYNGK